MASTSIPAWERRFRAPVISMPHWSRARPNRVVYASTESGVWQVHALDVATGARRRVTDHPVGVVEGVLTDDGEGVVWFQDESGDESGRWFVQPFEGGVSRPLLDGVPHGWNEGLSQRTGIAAAAISDRTGFAVYVSVAGGPAEERHRSSESVQIAGAELGVSERAGLSADGGLLCLEHGEHGDLMHPALRVIDPRTGGTIGDLVDDGLALRAACWSPVAGDHRLVFHHERGGEQRAGMWDLSSGGDLDLPINLPGEIRVHDWWPDGSALLLTNLQEGRDRLFRYDLSRGELSSLESPQGTIPAAGVRPDGRVWYLHSRAERPPVVLDQDGTEILRADGEEPPPGRPFASWHFQNPHGQRVHGFLVTPDGGGPFPLVMRVHGGPTSLDTDRWSPEVQAYVDAGFAVGLVNYRGSTGYGREWWEAVIGNVGGPELEDVNAGLGDLVSRGIADPERAVVAGWSWGGYVTLLELGKHPDLWVCGVAGIPVGDYAAGYQDLSPLLQAYDRALLGGTPSEVPELMRDRNPINFVDSVKAPVLILAGENDTRCPIRQVMLYVDRLEAHGHPHEVYLFATGHGSLDVEEEIRQQRRILEFLDGNVPNR